MSNEKIEKLRQELERGVRLPDVVCLEFLVREDVCGPYAGIRMLLDAIPAYAPREEAVAFRVVDPSYTEGTAEQAIDDYLSNDYDLPFIPRSEWPKTVLLLGVTKDGRDVAPEVVDVLAWCEKHAPSWLEEDDE